VAFVYFVVQPRHVLSHLGTAHLRTVERACYHQPALTLNEDRMATKQAVARTVDLEPIDRLEEKIKLLVNMVTRLREEQARAADERARLSQEIDTLRARLADAEETSVELVALRDERNVIRERVAEMLSQLETI